MTILVLLVLTSGSLFDGLGGNSARLAQILPRNIRMYISLFLRQNQGRRTLQYVGQNGISSWSVSSHTLICAFYLAILRRTVSIRTQLVRPSQSASTWWELSQGDATICPRFHQYRSAVSWKTFEGDQNSVSTCRSSSFPAYSRIFLPYRLSWGAYTAREREARGIPPELTVRSPQIRRKSFLFISIIRDVD